MKILTIGVFDLLHKGHINLIKKASELGDLIIAVKSSEGTLIIKGKKPLQSLEDRIRTIRTKLAKYIKLVVGIDNDEDKLIELLKPDIICRGDDWLDFPGVKTAKKLGMKTVYFKYTKGISSTKLRSKIEN